MIESPKRPVDHPDRLVDCEFAIEPAFQRVVAEAIAAGWTEGETTSAMIGLAANQAMGMTEDAETSRQIAVAQLMIAAMKRSTPEPS